MATKNRNWLVERRLRKQMLRMHKSVIAPKLRKRKKDGQAPTNTRLDAEYQYLQAKLKADAAYVARLIELGVITTIFAVTTFALLAYPLTIPAYSIIAVASLYVFTRCKSSWSEQLAVIETTYVLGGYGCGELPPSYKALIKMGDAFSSFGTRLDHYKKRAARLSDRWRL